MGYIIDKYKLENLTQWLEKDGIKGNTEIMIIAIIEY